MTNFDYDLFVIGAGSGGVRAARLVGATGKKVAIAEKFRVGGTCVIRGCVPKKIMVYAASFARQLIDAKAYGWNFADEQSFDWQKFCTKRNNEVDRLNNIYKQILANNNVKLIEKQAKIVDKHKVEVDGKIYSAKTILIATGGKPFIPEIEGCEHLLSSNEVFHLKELPKSMLVWGGGYISLEFASIFSALGVDVSLVFRADKPLKGFDEDVRDRIFDTYKTYTNIYSANNIEKVAKLNNGDKRVTFKNGEEKDFTEVLCALGRNADIDDLYTNNLDIALTKNGSIKVDENYQTNISGIYALGDVIDKISLTPVAIRQAISFANKQFLHKEAKQIDYEFLPTTLFSYPNFATIGYSEADAKDKFANIEIYKTEFKPMKNSISGREEKIFMKLVVNKDDRRVIGVHLIGDEVGEVMQAVAIAINKKATKEDFDSTMAIHPTFAEELVTM